MLQIDAATFTRVVTLLVALAATTFATAAEPTIKAIPTQYIAALGAADETSGGGAQDWGLWRKDPGPRGVWLRFYGVLIAAGGYAPALWKFDQADWWLDENGLIMEKPVFPLPAGQYLVTGDRETKAILTIQEPDETGDQKWQLSDDAKLYDVTHLPCRSSRFTPANADATCSPANAAQPAFPISVGTVMPDIQGCTKQDYSVLFVIGKVFEG